MRYWIMAGLLALVLSFSSCATTNSERDIAIAQLALSAATDAFSAWQQAQAVHDSATYQAEFAARQQRIEALRAIVAQLAKKK